MTDDELMREAQESKEKLLNFFLRQGVSFEEAEDLVQETYVRLWNYRRDYKPTAKLSTFLFLMARQVRIDALRRATRRKAREERWGKERPDVVPAATMGLREDVRWALGQLPDEQREVVELAVYQDLPYAEIAAIVGIPVGTVKSRMFNALRKLREVLNDG